ncbi:CRISPR-associated helicase Cas3 [hydrothermal vent metagenome]|uniref:CRISPR-associated helicase Cas3 n=1 Tax=hydrothermal vent metagenome TaxID=652676 RepID=A0A3B0Z0Y5_9ZZZZ
MNRVYYAHSGDKTDKSDWQLLSDHLKQVGKIAAENSRYFDAKALAEIAGLLHDVGKYTEGFQSRLEGGVRVDHATAGAKIAFEKWDRLGKVISYIVAGHHAGLANGIDSGENRSTLHDRLQKAVPELDAIWKEDITLPDQLVFPSFEMTEKFEGFQIAFLIRMLFSCLVDADFIDTEIFYAKLKGEKKSRGNHPPLHKLQKALDKYLEELKRKVSVSHSPSKVNNLRQKVLDFSRKQALLPSGVFSLTVPTGGGKTLTSMAFALDHAIAHKLRRIIYVIPFTSIIEQNANVFREVFKELGEDIVLEHHSAFDDKKFDGREETKDKLKLQPFQGGSVTT